MSLSAISSTSTVHSTTAAPSTTTAIPVGERVSFGVGAGAAGAYIAQGPNSTVLGGGAPGAPGGSLVAKLGIGAVVGAGLGFAASFIHGLSFIPHFKIVLPAAGAALGALAGGALHFFAKRKATLAMEAQATAAQQQSAAQAVAPPAVSGGTLKVGSRGPAARKIQTELKQIGLYDGKVNGTFDNATATAVRKYEVLKGAPVTGLGTPEVRSAITAEASNLSRLV